MCGIVGYIGTKNATEVLIEGLRKLEYRGYDSAGVAVRDSDDIHIVRAEGKLKNLEDKLRREPVAGQLGIGHTRWATHGRPTESNAHPHRAGPVVLVHNGIIENHHQLREDLVARGHTIKSETDTEIVCHLIQQRMYDGLPMREAFRKALSELKGTYALVVLNHDEPDRLYIARKGSPLVIGLGEGENFVASDIPALLPYTRNVLFLEYEEAGVVTRDKVEIWDAEGRSLDKTPTRITWDQTMAEKGGHKHFMIKEILEQPRAIADTLSGRISDEGVSKVVLDGLDEFLEKRGPFDSIDLIACGTSYHAGLVGKFWIEEFTRLPVNVDLASEYRYRNPILSPKKLVVAVSQSGETADTLAAILEAQKKGAGILSLCNVVGSSIARASDVTLYTRAGPEIGVASTKAFTTQLVLLLLLGLHLAECRKTLAGPEIAKCLDEVLRLPDLMGTLLKDHRRIQKIAKKYASAKGFLYFARGANYPIAYEGALKLKEISYIHAEGYAAGEMKHGPIALIDSDMPVVVLAPRDAHYEKVLSNLEEARARGARIIGVGTEGDEKLEKLCEDMVGIPEVPWYLQPLLTVIPLQLLAYYIADHKGTDVDQPRNLAKSVTVE